MGSHSGTPSAATGEEGRELREEMLTAASVAIGEEQPLVMLNLLRRAAGETGVERLPPTPYMHTWAF